MADLPATPCPKCGLIGGVWVTHACYVTGAPPTPIPSNTVSAMTLDQWREAWQEQWRRAEKLAEAVDLLKAGFALILDEGDPPMEFAGVVLRDDPGYVRGIASAALDSMKERGL